MKSVEKSKKEQFYTPQQSEKIREMLRSFKASGTSFYIALGFEIALVIITRFLRAKEFFGIESLLYVMIAIMAVFLLVLTLVFIKYLSSYRKLKKYLKKIDKNTEKITNQY